MSKSHFQRNLEGAIGSDPEVVAQAPRRKAYTVAYKLRVLAEADALAGKNGGELGAFLRREGLYSSHLSQWRKQRAQGLLGERKRRGRAGKDRDALAKEILQLKRRLAASEKRAAQAEFLVDLQKKISLLMGRGSEPGIGEA